MPDVFAVVNGLAVFVEIKFGKDRIAAVQKQAISDLIASGAAVYVAHSFQGFYDWFTDLNGADEDTDALPFGPALRSQD